MTKRAITESQVEIYRKILLGDRVIRTHDVRKNPHIPVFLHTILDPDYYVSTKIVISEVVILMKFV